MFFTNKINISFCIKYNDSWYPLIRSKEKFISSYPEIYFENWSEIKKQIFNDYYRWIQKIKFIKKSYDEISQLKEFKMYYKTDSFYKRCEEIIRRNLILLVKSFKERFDDYNRKRIKINDITFEFLSYHIFNTDKFLNTFHKCLTTKIQNILYHDFDYYYKSNNNDDKYLALYNYIIKLYKIFEKADKEFIKNGKKLKINSFDIQAN